MTSNYPPDYGISSGATMSLSLKSGTQKFHGELWEFNRNTGLQRQQLLQQAVDPGHTKSHAQLQHLRRQYRRPAVHPARLQHQQNRRPSSSGTKNGARFSPAPAPTSRTLSIRPTFPMAGQDLTYVPPGFAPGRRHRGPEHLHLDVLLPDEAESLGLTPGRCWNGPTLFDSKGNVSGCQDPQVIPASLFDPNGVLYLNSRHLPKPNVASEDKNIANVSNSDRCPRRLVRIDHKFNDKWAILGHYMHDSVTQGYALPFLGWLWASYNTVTSTLSNPSNSAAIKLTGTINPNLLVEASINYDGNIIDITNSAN